MSFIADTIIGWASDWLFGLLLVALSALVAHGWRSAKRVLEYIADRHVDLTVYLTLRKELRTAGSILLVMFGVVGATTYGFGQANYAVALAGISTYFLAMIGIMTTREASQLAKWDQMVEMRPNSC